jgi:hypothetical protein
MQKDLITLKYNIDAVRIANGLLPDTDQVLAKRLATYEKLQNEINAQLGRPQAERILFFESVIMTSCWVSSHIESIGDITQE